MITYMLLGRTLGIVVQVYMVSTFEIDLKVSSIVIKLKQISICAIC